jgi:hypothetical protein
MISLPFVSEGKMAESKKRTQLGESKKRLILQVANEVFAEKGFKWYFAVQNAGFLKI